MSRSDTDFAPAERAAHEQLLADATRARNEPFLQELLDAMPTWAVVVNRQRQVVAANRKLLRDLNASDLQSVLGKRPGDVIDCGTAQRAPNGCGTARPCAYCGASAMLEAWELGRPVTRECLVPRDLEHGGALDLEVVATPLTRLKGDLMIVAIRDVSAEKRRRVLERAFFHDVMNTASGIHGMSKLLVEGTDPIAEGQLVQYLLSFSEKLVDEIAAHRQLMAAECGDLHPCPSTVEVRQLLGSLHAMYGAHELCKDRQLVLGSVPNATVVTDVALLRRVLGNLLANALEATPCGATVRIWAEDLGDQMMFAVHNPGVVPEATRDQLFPRSFSTKGVGRGIGTYSVKLLGETYLSGRVDFTSNEAQGTTFTFVIPADWRGRAAHR